MSTRRLKPKAIVNRPWNAANDNKSGQTSKFWNSRFARDLSTEEIRQIKENVVGFFATLGEWSKAEMLVAANDNLKTGGVRDES